MDVQTLTQTINAVGFPIFVAVFMLIKQSKDTQQMRDTLTQLNNSIVLLATNTKKVGDTNE